jgi:putative restriction endonuclease
MRDANEWLLRLSRLRLDRARGDCAPHKPLLLLVLCDLAERGLISGDTIELTPDIASRFLSYWPIVAHRRKQKPDVRFPFYHLGSDGVWVPLDDRGEIARSRLHAKLARLTPDLVQLLSDPDSRDRVRHLLIAKYFLPSERIALYESVGLETPSDLEIEQNATYRSPAEAKVAGREARFKIGVLAAYDYTCTLTGYRLTTVTSGSIVDAAHIHQFADSRNNDMNNGMALCKNAHWLFDQGLWTVSEDFRAIVALGAFAESADEPSTLLARMDGKRLHLPRDRALWPSPVHISWHRRRRFVAV